MKDNTINRPFVSKPRVILAIYSINISNFVITILTKIEHNTWILHVHLYTK
ncbi:hypothetical protein HanIR_Chr08g0350371 [Helianthus annuus]|nr:hypothetical protein HanIR_Chr08g0350371 [Helianthus annuus]